MTVMVIYFVIPLAIFSYNLEQVISYRFYNGDPDNKYAAGN